MLNAGKKAVVHPCCNIRRHYHLLERGGVAFRLFKGMMGNEDGGRGLELKNAALRDI